MKILLLLLVVAFSTCATAEEKPKLVVGIIVDQMRYDYLSRYWDKYGTGGFKRLVTQGVNCKNAHFNYIPTYTGPGHASIYTGTTPAVHGIIGNQWYDKHVKQIVNCVADPAARSVDIDYAVGQKSPQYLQVTTITDELKLSSNNQAKIIGISFKDRGAILPAGHIADAAYWFVDGKFISSTHYMQKLPQWVEEFNKSARIEKYINSTWETLLPIEKYTESLPDDNHYENIFGGKEKPVFPYDLKKLKAYNGGYGLLSATPFGNSYLVDFALQALAKESLGKNKSGCTDFLAISFSSTDIIGHYFGIRAIETQDTYLRLDADLARLLDELDKIIGKDKYVVFLTADHGAAEVPAYFMDMKIPAGYAQFTSLHSDLNRHLSDIYGEGNYIENISNLQVFLNRTTINAKKLSKKIPQIQENTAEYLLDLPEVALATTASNLKKTEFSQGILALLQKGFHHERSGDILMALKPNWINYGETGTTHGSGYTYDTQVPVIFYGAGIKQQQVFRRINITDIAATLCALLNIQQPNGCEGQPIKEVLE